MDEARVRKWLHDLNNRIGMVLANAELMQFENLTPKALERTKLIEEKTLEIRQIVRDIGDHLLE
jgi:hypothetical protein